MFSAPAGNREFEIPKAVFDNLLDPRDLDLGLRYITILSKGSKVRD